MHKHNFGQTLKLQSAVVTVIIRSRSLNLIDSFLSPNKLHVSMPVWCRKKPLVQKRAQKRLDLQFFKEDYLEMRRHQNHINSSFCHNDTIHEV